MSVAANIASIQERIAAATRRAGRRSEEIVLIAVNLGGEEAKSGVAHDSLALEELLLAAPRLDALAFRGLMTVPPFTEDQEGARPYFRKLRELRAAITSRKLPSVALDQ